MICKTLILWIFLICVCQCFEGIPSPNEIRDLIRINEITEEMNLLLSRKHQNDNNDIPLKRSMLEQCDDHYDDALLAIDSMMKELKQSKKMRNEFSGIPHQIAFCVMNMLMGRKYYVAYDINDNTVIIHAEKQSYESIIRMKGRESCECITTYELYCGWDKEKCTSFQAQFMECIEKEDVPLCFNPLSYAGMMPAWSECSLGTCKEE
jgi:hypothetical protein